MTALSYGSRTDTGRRRKKNQDRFTVAPSERLGGRVDGLFVVADGMGGHAGGEIASRVAADTVPAVVAEVLEEIVAPPDPEVMAGALRRAIAAANEAVWKQARANPELRGMGTTCVALLMRNGQAAVAHVGDSRVYLLRGGELRRITEDHSLVQERVRAGDLTDEEAQNSRFRNVITRAVGMADEVEPDVDILDVEDGDTFLLCSDGLTTMVAEQEIARVLGDADPQAACDRLVDEANANGGEDNVTAVVVRHGAPVIGATHPAPSTEYRTPNTQHPAPNDRTPTTEHRRPGAPLWAMVGLTLASLALGIGVGFLVNSRLRSERAPLGPRTAPAASIPGPDLGRLLYAPGAPVAAAGVLGGPLTADAAGNVYAVLIGTGRIQRFDSKGQASGDFPAPLARPMAPPEMQFASDPQGYLYVSLRHAHRIEKYAPSGTRVATIGAGQLGAPEGIAVDAAGDIYVVDKGVLLRFRALPPGSATPPPTRPTANDGRPATNGTDDRRRMTDGAAGAATNDGRRTTNGATDDGRRVTGGTATIGERPVAGGLAGSGHASRITHEAPSETPHATRNASHASHLTPHPSPDTQHAIRHTEPTDAAR